LVEGEDGQKCVLKSAYEVFKNDSQMLSVVVDMLLKYQVVECPAVANWVFSKEMQPEFMK
jgi:nuclear cap-binding protein subunit 1